ncbi:hypothetical protein DSO57_1002042 [Entomophthora muscae]|uniref:Uncharacterized protein n=1 Tax=Entomophthora muscae TaxID=34485 RepID=A0ACC2SAV0_9FUNG|nr:hypothetical protein DSO57_1002042 [Entomophthora muscae]
MEDNRITQVTREATLFWAQIGDITNTLSDPIIPISKYNLVLSLYWMRNTKTHIDCNSATLTIQQEEVHHYLYLPGIVRIVNYFPLENQAQGWDLNPDPEFMRATGPKDQGATCPRFPEVKLLQDKANNDGLNSEAKQNKGINAPNGGVIKSTLVANQEPSLEEGIGPQPNPMTTTIEQDNQVANSRSLTNERTPTLSAILPPLNPSTQIPWVHFFQFPDEPLMENIKFGSGYKIIWPSCLFTRRFLSSGCFFGPIHFTEYPLKPEYKDYTPKKILELDSLACIQSAVRYNCQGPWIFSTPKLFRGKFNYLPAYNLPMEPAVTPKPIPGYSPDLPTNHIGKLFGIVLFTSLGN